MRPPGGWLTLEKWGAVVTTDNGAGVRLPRSVPRPAPPPGPRARLRKPGWLGMVRLVGPGCIRYRECTQVHNIYTVYIWGIYILYSGYGIVFHTRVTLSPPRAPLPAPCLVLLRFFVPPFLSHSWLVDPKIQEQQFSPPPPPTTPVLLSPCSAGRHPRRGSLHGSFATNRRRCHQIP
jgi:hypothetical protein